MPVSFIHSRPRRQFPVNRLAVCLSDVSVICFPLAWLEAGVSVQGVWAEKFSLIYNCFAYSSLPKTLCLQYSVNESFENRFSIALSCLAPSFRVLPCLLLVDIQILTHLDILVPSQPLDFIRQLAPYRLSDHLILKTSTGAVNSRIGCVVFFVPRKQN